MPLRYLGRQGSRYDTSVETYLLRRLSGRLEAGDG
jgi:hypothetical protein